MQVKQKNYLDMLTRIIQGRKLKMAIKGKECHLNEQIS